MPVIVILSTASSKREAQKITQFLLKEGLVACVNIVPAIESHYLWQGKLTKSKEYLLVIKAPKASFSKIEKAIRKVHSYDVPEVIAMPITEGSKPYLRWLNESTR